MPLLSTLGSAGVQSYGTSGIVTGGSAFFDSVNDYLTAPAGTAFQYGTGDFTIEMWIYPTTTSSPSGNGVTLFRQRGSNYNSQRYLFLFLWPTNQIFLQVAGNDFYIGTQNTVTLNAWNHVALVRRSNSMRIFLNGYANNARTNTTNFSDTSAYNLAFGNLVFNNQYTFQGYMTNIRVAKSAYYTATFEPSRVPFTRTSQGATNVQLLLNCRNTATLSTDSSANALTVTNNSVTFDTATPYKVLYTTPPTVTPVSVTVTPSTLTGSEGTAITFTIAGTNTTNGTYYYTIEQASGSTAIATTDFTSASLSGSFTMTSNSGSFNITPAKDLFTEGTETFSVAVRSTSITGPILGASDEITIADISITPTVTPSAATVNEGSSVSFTAANVGPDGTYYWTVSGISAGDVTASSGSFVVSGSTGGIDNGTGTFSITTVADRTTEGSETMNVQVRSGSTSGTVVASTSVTILDISLTPSASFVNNPNIAELTGNNGGLATSTTLRVSNLGPAGTYYWSITNNTGTLLASDLTGGSLTGSFTTSTLNGSADIVFTAAADTVAETGSLNQFQIQIREGSTTGTVLITTGNSIIIYDSSVVVSAIAPNPASEGNGLNITLTTPLSQNQGLVQGQYWLTFESTGSAVAADVLGLPASFNVTGLGNYFVNGVVSIRSTDGAEGAETFRIGVRQGTTTGTLVGLSPVITINASAT
jgi:hypothetical protein